METKSDWKLEGDKVVVTFTASEKVDKDADGAASVEFESQNTLKLDGSELLEEFLANTEWLKFIKGKLGVA